MVFAYCRIGFASACSTFFPFPELALEENTITLYPPDVMLITSKENLCICLMCTNELIFGDHDTKATMLQSSMFRQIPESPLSKQI